MLMPVFRLRETTPDTTNEARNNGRGLYMSAHLQLPPPTTLRASKSPCAATPRLDATGARAAIAGGA
jgi:hypothetical protein